MYFLNDLSFLMFIYGFMIRFKAKFGANKGIQMAQINCGYKQQFRGAQITFICGNKLKELTRSNDFTFP